MDSVRMVSSQVVWTILNLQARLAAVQVTAQKSTAGRDTML
jgi:hypothetical protein